MKYLTVAMILLKYRQIQIKIKKVVNIIFAVVASYWVIYSLKQINTFVNEYQMRMIPMTILYTYNNYGMRKRENECIPETKATN